MERTKGIVKQDAGLVAYAQLLGDLVGRMQLATTLGMQYAGERDIYKALGYPQTSDLKFEDYYGRYCRQDIAKAVIDRPVRGTWQGPLELIESEETKDTEFEKAWVALNLKLSLKAKLSRLDRLTGLGRYGVLLLGLDDVSTREGFERPVKEGARTLKYVKPFGETSAKILTYVTNPSDERFGLPLMYAIETVNISTGATILTKVHHSRMLHVTDEALESEIYGIPRLQSIYNRLMDLDKVIGGDAEMFWRGARPGYEGKVDPQYTMTPKGREDLISQISEYENNLRRILINEGVELKSLAQQIADPSPHFMVILQAISAETGIPVRVLTGSERGELASSQDAGEWKAYVQARREEHAETNIIRPLVGMLLKYGVLPSLKTENYTVKWNDLYSLSEKDRVEIGKSRANALREYTYSPMSEAIVPPDAFFDLFLGLTPEQITLIREQRDELISQEDLYDKILGELEPEPVVMPGQSPAGGTKSTPAKPTKKNTMSRTK